MKPSPGPKLGIEVRSAGFLAGCRCSNLPPRVGGRAAASRCVPEHSPSRDCGQTEMNRVSAALSLHLLHLPQEGKKESLPFRLRFHRDLYSILRRLQRIRTAMQSGEVGKEAVD